MSRFKPGPRVIIYDGPTDHTPIRPWPTEVTDEMVARAADALAEHHGTVGHHVEARIALEAALLERSTPGESGV